jgi:hypothetical protein
MMYMSVTLPEELVAALVLIFNRFDCAAASNVQTGRSHAVQLIAKSVFSFRPHPHFGLET